MSDLWNHPRARLRGADDAGLAELFAFSTVRWTMFAWPPDVESAGPQGTDARAARSRPSATAAAGDEARERGREP